MTSGTPRYSCIRPVTQTPFPSYLVSGVPNLGRSEPQITTCQNPSGICTVQIDEGWLAPASNRVVSTCHVATYRCRFSDVITGLRSCDCLRCEGRCTKPHCQDKNQAG